MRAFKYTLFFIRTTLNLYEEQWGSDWPKIRNNLRTSSGWGWKKVKMFLVEILLNLVIYVRNVHSKNIEAPFPIYYYYNYYIL